MRNEIALWSGVELVDANRVLLPAEAVQDSSIDNILQMSSFEPEQLYLFRLTLLDIVCRQFGLCLFLDVRQSFRSRISLTTVNKGLSEQGHILGCEDALPQTMAARSLFACDLLGFTFKSPAYEALVQTPLKWFRKNMCGYDWIRQKLDTFSMIGANVFPLAKLFETDSDAPVNQYYCFISFREDILYNFQFLSTRENTLPPVIDNKVRIGLGVPTSGMIFMRGCDGWISWFNISWQILFYHAKESTHKP